MTKCETCDIDGEYQFSEKQAEMASEMLDSLIFWSEKLKQARVEL